MIRTDATEPELPDDPQDVAAAVAEEVIAFSSPAGDLVGTLAYDPDATPRESCLLLSPHPSLGGDQDNNVVRRLARELARSARVSLRFDYRGAGRSVPPGADPLDAYRRWSELLASDRIDDVVEQALAARDELSRARLPTDTLIGYSFGAAVALRWAARDESVRRVVAIGISARDVEPESLAGVACPVLAVHGDRDFATSIPALDECLGRVGGALELEVLAGADHFFRGREGEVAEHVVRFLDRNPSH